MMILDRTYGKPGLGNRYDYILEVPALFYRE